MKERPSEGGREGERGQKGGAAAMLSDVLVTLFSSPPLLSLLVSSPLLSLFYNRWEITAENGALNFPHFVTADHPRLPPPSSFGALTRHLPRGMATCSWLSG